MKPQSYRTTVRHMSFDDGLDQDDWNGPACHSKHRDRRPWRDRDSEPRRKKARRAARPGKSLDHFWN